MAAAHEVCPVVGTTTTVLPPHHPAYDTTDPEARCPITNAKVGHHDTHIQNHPSSPTVPKSFNQSMDAAQCPALKNAEKKDDLVDALCPVVGPVSAYLPPSHPKLTEKEAGTICPVTNAKLEHHQDKVHAHPGVPEGAPVQKCPVAGSLLG